MSSESPSGRLKVVKLTYLFIHYIDPSHNFHNNFHKMFDIYMISYVLKCTCCKIIEMHYTHRMVEDIIEYYDNWNIRDASVIELAEE